MRAVLKHSNAKIIETSMRGLCTRASVPLRVQRGAEPDLVIALTHKGITKKYIRRQDAARVVMAHASGGHSFVMQFDSVCGACGICRCVIMWLVRVALVGVDCGRFRCAS